MHSYSDRDLYTISKVVSGHIQPAGADPGAQTISRGGTLIHNQPGGTPGGSLYTPDRLPALVMRKTLHHAGIVVFFLTMDGIQRRNCTN